MALVRTLTKGLRKTPRQGGNPMDVDGPTVTISGYPTDPTDDPTPTFTFSANESGCTFEYKVNAGSYAACTSPLTLAAQTDGAYTIYIRATDKQGNVGSATTYSWDLATAYVGSFPATAAALNGWTLASPWTVLHNFTSATVGPSACSSATGSETLNLIKLGSDNTATLESAGQGGYATQGGYTVNTNQDFMYAAPAASWKFSATVPTAYLATIKFDGTPANGQTFLGGSDGTGGGWWLEAHSTSGIRAAVGSGGGYVNTSYVGGTSLYDGEYHTIMLVIDDAAGKAKIFTEFGNTESTGLTLASGSAYYTLGPVGAGLTWGTAVTYLLSARGEHPLLYANAQSLFDEYEDARLNNVNQTAIAGLPTSITELNTVSGMTFDYAYNIGSNAPSPMTGSSGSALAADTGVLHSATNGTAPTTGTAPRVRTSFTSQGSAVFDSSYDNLAVPDLPESRTQSVIMLIWKAANTADASALITRGQGTDIGWYARIDPNDSLGVRVRLSSASSASYSVASQAIGGWVISMIKWHGSGASGAQLLHSAANGAAEQVFTTTQTLGSNSTSNSGYIGASKATNGYTTPTVHTSRTLEVALVAWKASPSPLPDAAALTAAIAATRWRYGI